MRAASALVVAVVFAGCGGTTRMGGFAERDARAVEAAPSEVITDGCALRRGRLVVEVERAVINEFPHRDDSVHRRQQPLLVRSLAFTQHLDDERDLQSWITPRKVQPGERIDGFEGLRLLDLPLRRAEGRSLIVRLAENDRTFPPEWVTRATQASGAVGGAAALGITVPPAAVVQEGVELFARLDRDDRILTWTVALEQLERDTAPPADEVGTAGNPPPRPARRYRLATTRHLPSGAGPALPFATLNLLAYREPEPGCGNRD
jgi:hypothetical protein